jgi:calpain-15
MVLEKAWAKIFGSYSNIIAGNPRECLKALTGGATWQSKTSDDDFEAKFKDGYERKCIMVAGSRTEA